VAHWSSRPLAAELGLFNVKITDAWREYGLQPWRKAHEYVRGGTPALFAALEVAVGMVIDACCPCRQHEGFLRFLRQVANAYPGKRP
jgi:hypothetical protein